MAPQLLDPRGPRAYVSDFAAGTVSVVDLATGAPLATFATGRRPYGIVVSPNGRVVGPQNPVRIGRMEFCAPTALQLLQQTISVRLVVVLLRGGLPELLGGAGLALRLSLLRLG